MKMILQKHTSKFVAGVFNSLGITACVSLTSCGDENKGKQTENQGEELKNKLMSKGLDDKDAQVIVDWLNSNGKDSNYELTAKDLQEIFKNNPNKLNEVAGRLEVKLTESDDEKKKEINKWLNKLKSLNCETFNELGDDLKEKVAQKFIDNEIDIANDDIKEKLAGFINEVVEEKKASEITLKIEGEGKVSITNVAGDTITNFAFDNIEGFKKFVDYLNEKDITTVDGKLSFAFDGKIVKVGGHKVGFDITGCFGAFLNCLNTLVGFEKLNVPKLSLKLTGEGVSLNEVACNDDYYKGSDFWSLVKDHADLFGITDENKFEIEKKGEESATVKIGEFETKLSWSEVVVSENTLSKESGWGKIFNIKSKEEHKPEDPKTKVKIEWNVKDGYKLGDAMSFTKIDNLKILGDLVNDLKDKTVTEFKGDFTLKFNGQNVNICGGGNIDITSGKNFEQLLGYVKTLRDVKKVINSGFQIPIATSNKGIKLNDMGINQDFIKTATFWDAVQTYKDLFDGLPIEVEKNKENNKGKIGKTVINVEMFSGEDIAQEWKEIFKKK